MTSDTVEQTIADIEIYSFPKILNWQPKLITNWSHLCRILVLDKGQISEFDAPNKLLENKLSIFYGLAKEAGII